MLHDNVTSYVFKSEVKDALYLGWIIFKAIRRVWNNVVFKTIRVLFDNISYIFLQETGLPGSRDHGPLVERLSCALCQRTENDSVTERRERS